MLKYVSIFLVRIFNLLCCLWRIGAEVVACQCSIWEEWIIQTPWLQRKFLSWGGSLHMKPFRQLEVQWGWAWSCVCRPGWGQVVVVFITGASGCFI